MRKIKMAGAHNYFFLSITVMLVVIGILTIFLLKGSFNLKKVENERHKLFLLGNELKESSNDLTRYCRTFVLTGDPKWESKYWEVLEVRNGKKARANGSFIALIDTIQKVGILKNELELLKISEENSNNLVWTENVAFHAIRGEFADSSKQFNIRRQPDTLFSQKILFNKKYDLEKEKIMTPIFKFYEVVGKRTELKVNSLEKRQNKFLVSIITMIFIIAFLAFYAIYVLRKKVTFNLEKLEQINIVLNTKNSNIESSNQRLKISNETKDKFFSIIAHDLKSPFNSIVGLSNILLKQVREKNDDGIEKFAGMIKQSSNHAMDLLMNLMEWSRSQTGRIEFNPEYIEMMSLVNETALIFDDIAGQKTITIARNLDANAHVYADRAMVSTILRNLISNAIKFTQTNGRVTISAVDKKNELTVSVSDNGVGISEDRIDKLFNISENYATQGTEKEKGTGLGLILCQEFIQKNNGDIWVESKVGIGSTFYFSLPLGPEGRQNIDMSNQ